MRPYRLFNQLFCMLVSLTAPRPQYHFFSSPVWVCVCVHFTPPNSLSLAFQLTWIIIRHSICLSIWILPWDLGVCMVSESWRYGKVETEITFYEKTVCHPFIRHAYGLIFFPILYCAPFFSLSIHLFCYCRFVWRRSFEVLWMHECRICICVHV